MELKAIELVENYWILVDQISQDEYLDSTGNNLMFISKKEAKEFIKTISEVKQ